MKPILTIFIFFLYTATIYGQAWSEAQLQKANTAADEYKLSDAEKEVILYINLCRLYPAEFAEKELKEYQGVANVKDANFNAYKASLAGQLLTGKACQALYPDELLYDDAKCYGNEISKNKRKPHERIDCLKRGYAECLYFGSGEGKHIAMQWLIDSGVESLGHRTICLQPAFRKVAVKINPHFEYGYCAVGEFDR